jgi:hypothetical protein
MSERVNELVTRLRKGASKTAEILGSLTDVQWDAALYEEPYRWTVRDLAAHFFSSEVGLLRIMQDVAAGGPGAPEGFDFNEFNAQEHGRLAGLPPRQLLVDLAAAREATIAWVAGLSDADLDCAGCHPALGQINLETFINAIYGHQLMHMRDLSRLPVISSSS